MARRDDDNPAMTPSPGVVLRVRWRRVRRAIARSWHVPPDCHAAHAALVRARLRSLSSVLAVLTLAWIPLDMAGLGPGLAARAVPLRLAMMASLLLLGRFAGIVRPQAAVLVFAWSQAIIFGGLQWLAGSARDSALGIGYGLFPFILVVQFAVLPLPWWRTLLAALAPAAQLLVTTAILGNPRGAVVANGLWLFVVLTALATWASHAQVRLLVDLLGARRDAAHDALTGLPNRRMASERLEAERTRALRLGEPLSVLMIDIDRFKNVNDHWGHAHGDRVLVALGGLLQHELRGADLGARYGGEEFFAILPGAGIFDAMEVAERIRVHIAQMRIPVDGTLSGITVSIGAATLAGGETAANLIERADSALYAAKAAGRNRCIAAPVATRTTVALARS